MHAHLPVIDGTPEQARRVAAALTPYGAELVGALGAARVRIEVAPGTPAGVQHPRPATFSPATRTLHLRSTDREAIAPALEDAFAFAAAGRRPERVSAPGRPVPA